MTLQVIGAGLGRTGTHSLKLALERLGFGPCLHMTEVIGNPAQIDFWNRVSDGGPVDWRESLVGWRSTTDWPGCAFHAELAEAFPDARVVLTVRDPARWHASMAETILKSLPQTGMDKRVADDHPMRFGERLVTGRTFGHDLSRENVIAAFERHNADVIARTPPGRLLVYEAGQGWEPLCAFLGVAVPDEPYPRTNARDEFWTHAEKLGASRD